MKLVLFFKNLVRFLASLPFLVKTGLIVSSFTLVLYWLGLRSPLIVEKYYAQGFYPLIAPCLSFVFSLIPFSLTDISIIILIVSAVVVLISEMRKIYLSTSRMPQLLISLAYISSFTGVCISTYLLFWGFNFLRPPISDVFHLPVTDEKDEINILEYAASKTNVIRAELSENRAGCIDMTSNLEELDEIIEPLQQAIFRKNGLSSFPSGPSKKRLMSNIWLQLGASGIYGPFTGEKNITWPSAPGIQPFIVAHERSHYSGIATEDGANFVAILTLWESDFALIKYSGWLAFWMLYPAEELSNFRLNNQVKKDLLCIENFWRGHLGSGSELSWEAYDNWLRFQGVESGVSNYNEATKLVISYLSSIR